MTKLTDKELLEELQFRFSQNKKSLEELSALTKQLQSLNHKLKESERLKSQFLSNIRNEINNPLTSILGLSKNIQDADARLWERTKNMAALIHAEAFNLDFQLRNIFAAAEFESGELSLEIILSDIHTIVHAVLEMHRHRAESKNLTIHYSCAEGHSSATLFKTDPAKLQLVLSNLLANAIEYSFQHSSIHIKVHRADEELKISIQDFGIGITRADQERIFNRFTQLQTGITKPHKGHGLGLSVTKALIELLGGTIELISNKAEGSIFTVSFKESTAEITHFTTDGSDLFFNEGELF